MSLPLPARVVISPDALFEELQGEAVLLDLKSERYYGLDDVGTRMWQLLAEDADVAAACSQLMKEYDVEPARLQDDLAVLLARLAEAGLLSVTAPAADDPSAATNSPAAFSSAS